MPIHAFEFLKPKKSAQPVKPFFAVFGDDAYLRHESIQAIVKLALGPDADDLAVTRMPGDTSTLADVLDEVRTLPFLTKCRVVIVEEADKFVTAHRKELEGYAEKPSATNVLVLSVKSWPGNTKLAKLVDQVGLSIEAKAPGEAQLPGHVKQWAQSHADVKIDDEAASLLVDLVGPEIGLLHMEIEKLAVYVGDRKAVNRTDVARMVGSGRVETIWRALEAATTGNMSEALEDFDRLVASGEAPVRIIAAMGYSLRNVHHAGQLRRAKLDLADACRQAGIYSSHVEQTRRQHAHLGPGRVDQLPAMLLKADLDLKGNSSLIPRVILERLVVQLASKRKD